MSCGRCGPCWRPRGRLRPVWRASPSKCELASEYTSVFEDIDPGYLWRDVAKMRSKIAHPYGGFDFDFVWDAIQVDLPGLISICERAISV